MKTIRWGIALAVLLGAVSASAQQCLDVIWIGNTDDEDWWTGRADGTLLCASTFGPDARLCSYSEYINTDPGDYPEEQAHAGRIEQEDGDDCANWTSASSGDFSARVQPDGDFDSSSACNLGFNSYGFACCAPRKAN